MKRIVHELRTTTTARCVTFTQSQPTIPVHRVPQAIVTTHRFIALSAPIILAASFAAWVLPATYAQTMHPLAVTAAGLLSLWVAFLSGATMRKALFLIAAFLLLYAPTASSWILDQLTDALGGSFLSALLAYQTLTYAMLLVACVLIVRVMEVRRVHRDGWLVSAGVAAAGVIIVINGLSTFRDLLDISSEAGAIYLTIRIFDVLVMTALTPVLWLYVQNGRAKYQESATFMLVMIGIVLSLVLVYFYELAKQAPLIDVAAEYQTGSLLDSLYLLGYLIIGAGLYAHRKHQDWSYAVVANAMEPS